MQWAGWCIIDEVSSSAQTLHCTTPLVADTQEYWSMGASANLFLLFWTHFCIENIWSCSDQSVCSIDNFRHMSSIPFSYLYVFPCNSLFHSAVCCWLWPGRQCCSLYTSKAVNMGANSTSDMDNGWWFTPGLFCMIFCLLLCWIRPHLNYCNQGNGSC